MYYLQSRYYNPEWGRFINTDGTTLDEGTGLLGYNMYMYCANNSINNFDEWRKMNSFGSIANNAGFIMQRVGAFTPYDWDITFSFTYHEK